MTWVWHDQRTSELRGNQMLAMLALADVADDDGNCVFVRENARSQNAMAAKARMSVATFRRATAELVEQGLLAVDRPTHQSTNSYRIVMASAQSERSSAQSERSPVSGASAQSERFQRSPVSGATSYIRINGLDVPDAFDFFWLTYPRKVAKEGARRAFAKALQTTSADVILAGVRRFAADPNLPEKQFIPHPVTWLNRGSWDDEPLPDRGGRPGPNDDFGNDEWLMRA